MVKKGDGVGRSYDVHPPGGESLKTSINARFRFYKTVIPLLREDKNVIISSHGNTLRAIIKYLDKVSPERLPLIWFPLHQLYIVMETGVPPYWRLGV